MLTRIVFGILLSPLALTLALPVASAEQPYSRAELYFGLAQGSYLSGDLAGARRTALETLRADPDFSPATALLARILLDEDRPDEALSLTTKLIEAEADNHEFLLLHALVLERTGDTEAAGDAIDTVLAEADPDSRQIAKARQLRGLQHMGQGDWAAASEVLGSEPEAGTATRILAGEAFAEAAAEHEAHGEFAEARAALDTALALAPDEAPDHRNRLLLARARLHGNRGRFDKAAADLEVITASDPGNRAAAVMLASIYATQERWEAVDGILPLIAEEPQFRDVVLYFEGRAAFARGRIGTARARFEEALELLEGSDSSLIPALRFYRGACLLELGRTSEADGEILLALESEFVAETAIEAWIAGTALLRAGRGADAVAAIEPTALRHADASVRLWTVLGRAHESAEEPLLALSAYDQALRLDPASADALAARAALKRGQRDIDGAIADYTLALDADPRNPALSYALGLSLLQAGQVDEAERHLGAAATALPEIGAVQLLHAFAAFAVGDLTASRRSLITHRQARTDETINSSALLLRYCLDLAEGRNDALEKLQRAVLDRRPPDSGLELLTSYFAGRITDEEMLELASVGPDRETAIGRYAETCFWMAQNERLRGNESAGRTLLKEVVRTGEPDLPEVQIAAWILAADAL